MTDTLEQPAVRDTPVQPAAVAPSGGPQSGGDPTLVTDILSTLALIGFTIAVSAGFARVFSGWQFFDDFVAMAVVGHGFGFLSRRLRIPGFVAVPAMAALMVWMISFVHYRDSMSMLIPTGDTLALFQQEISRVREEFRTAVAPVIYGGGWDVLAAIGIALTIVLSDAFAFRAFARAEALVPGGVLFVFVAALGADRSRVTLTMWLVAAGVVATVALRAHHGPPRTRVVGGTRSPIRSILPAALGMAAVVAVAASFVGPRLPGSDSEPIYETRGGNGGSVTNVISPLVDIRSRLTNQSNAELFTVSADFESYWRLSALPRFNGTEWGLPERALSRADGTLSTARDGATELRQAITITSLGDKFVPTAADPIAASPQDGLRWNADSSTLLKTDGDLAPGDTFEIVSASPSFAVADLQAATSTDAGDPIYLELPDDFPSSVGALAQEVTAGAATPYDIALTLQNWFRTEFDYSLEVQAGHSTTAIEGFLRDRVGYCEQFAGTYAAMLRTLGIPARVAVGFTAGNFNGERFSVLGKNAHAWPEVWFDGLGWVPFEPTPGRGAPGAENYTNVSPEQDATGVDPDSVSDEASPGAAPDVEISPQTSVAGPLTTTPEGLPIDDATTGGDGSDAAPAGASDASDAGNGSGGSFPLQVLLVLALLALAAAAPAVIRRWRRNRAPADAGRAVSALWLRSVDDLRELGIRPNPAATPLEHAHVAADTFPVVARPFGSLAAAVTEVSFSPDGTAHELDECRLWSRQIERAVNDSISPVARMRRYFTRLV